MRAHIGCLAKEFLDFSDDVATQLLPVEGDCPVCNANIVWGDVIRQWRRGLLTVAGGPGGPGEDKENEGLSQPLGTGWAWNGASELVESQCAWDF